MKLQVNISVIVFLSLAAINSIAQSVSPQEQSQIDKATPNPMPPSPTVASMEKFGNYPVSYFSGLPEISIPIYDVKSGELSVPITLSYHAAGIKPTDHAGWVGLGWALSAGGQISRNAQGKPDEQEFYTSGYKKTFDVCDSSASYFYLRDVANGVKDTQPDVWSYSYPGGKGGKFTLLNGKKPFMFPFAPVVVKEFFVPGGFGKFTKFEITDEHGVLHRFGQNAAGVAAIESTSSSSNGTPGMVGTTAWLLQESIAPNTDDNITYTYQDNGFSRTGDVSYSYTVQDEIFQTVIVNDMPSSVQSYQPVTKLNNPIVSDNYVTQIQLQNITFKTGKVEFVLDSVIRSGKDCKYLDHVNIWSLNSDGTYTMVKSVKFIYSTYGGTNGSTGGAMKLDAVQFRDNATSLIERYKFSYTTNTFSFDNTSMINARDQFGFYNGHTENTDLILTQSINYTTYRGNQMSSMVIGGAANRDVVPSFVQEGTLKRIDFPSGGYTIFTMESNQYEDFQHNAQLAGGLRIASIASYDGSGAPPKLKTYKYGLNESGTGKPNFTLTQFNYIAQAACSGRPCSAGLPELSYNSRTYFSTLAFSTDPFDGNPVLYYYVTEYFGTPTVNTGKIMYTYDNGVTVQDDNQTVPGSTRGYRDTQAWIRGKLTNKTTYDNLGHKVAESQWVYGGPYIDSPSMGLGVNALTNYIGNGGEQCINSTCTTVHGGDTIDPEKYFYVNFSQSTGSWDMGSENEITYDSSDPSISTSKLTVYSYDQVKFQMTKSVVDRGSGYDQTVTVNQYPFQLLATSASTLAAQGIYQLNTKNIVSKPFETYTYLQKTDGTNQRLVSAQLTTFKQNPSNANYTVPDQIYLWENQYPQALSSFAPAVLNGANNGLTLDSRYKPRVSLLNYDDHGNLQEVSQNNDFITSYRYGYNNAFPIAEVKNAQNTIYHYQTVSNGTTALGFTMGSNTPTYSNSYTFTTDYTGAVTLKINVPTGATATTTATYSGISGGSMTLTAAACGTTSVSLGTVSPGTYTVAINLSVSSGTSVGACGEIDYPKFIYTTNTAGSTEFYYENFEESVLATIDPTHSHSGKKYYTGHFTASFTPPNSRAYKIEYWYLDASNLWQYISKVYTGTSMVLSEGTAIDDVRIYPADAQMKSYTYDPILGMTSSINETAQMTRYEYDSYGRLHLVKDDQNKILKMDQYFYKDQN